MKYSLADFKNIISQNIEQQAELELKNIEVKNIENIENIESIESIESIEVKDIEVKDIEVKEIQKLETQSEPLTEVTNISQKEVGFISKQSVDIGGYDYLDKWFITKNEVTLMQQLYSKVNSYLYDFVIQVINEYDYKDSPIYSENGISREMLAQMVDRAIQLAYQSLEQVEEIKLQRDAEPLLVGKYWSSWDMLRANIESMLLNEIFISKRPTTYN